MKKTIPLIGLLGLIWLLLCSHEFWITASEFRILPGDRVQISLWVGENFTGDPWEGRANRITKLIDSHGKYQQNLIDSIHGKGVDSIYFSLKEKGTHCISLATDFKFIELEAEKFNAYLEEDGLETAIAVRRERRETNKPGRERYCRNAKTLIQAGAFPGDFYSDATGLTCEIIPLVNPYTINENDSITYELRFENKPLGNVLIRHWNKPTANDQHLIAVKRTSPTGLVTFEKKPGETLISAVYMRECPDKSIADWESYWTGITFR